MIVYPENNNSTKYSKKKKPKTLLELIIEDSKMTG